MHHSHIARILVSICVLGSFTGVSTTAAAQPLPPPDSQGASPGGACQDLVAPPTTGHTVYEVKERGDSGSVLWSARILKWGKFQPPSLPVRYKDEGCKVDLGRDVASIEHLREGTDFYTVSLVRGQRLRVKASSIWQSWDGPMLYVPGPAYSIQTMHPDTTNFSISSIVVLHNADLKDYEAKALAEAESKITDAERQQNAEQVKAQAAQEAAQAADAAKQAAADLAARKAVHAQQVAVITSPDGVGMQICKDATLDMVQRPNWPHYVGPGQIIASVEGTSPNRQRIQVRIIAAATPRALGYMTAQAGDWTLTPGMVYWDKTDDWYICESKR